MNSRIRGFDTSVATANIAIIASKRKKNEKLVRTLMEINVPVDSISVAAASKLTDV